MGSTSDVARPALSASFPTAGRLMIGASRRFAKWSAVGDRPPRSLKTSVPPTHQRSQKRGSIGFTRHSAVSPARCGITVVTSMRGRLPGRSKGSFLRACRFRSSSMRRCDQTRPAAGSAGGVFVTGRPRERGLVPYLLCFLPAHHPGSAYHFRPPGAPLTNSKTSGRIPHSQALTTMAQARTHPAIRSIAPGRNPPGSPRRQTYCGHTEYRSIPSIATHRSFPPLLCQPYILFPSRHFPVARRRTRRNNPGRPSLATQRTRPTPAGTCVQPAHASHAAPDSSLSFFRETAPSRFGRRGTDPLKNERTENKHDARTIKR
jgi:hypothetical protein